MNTKRFIYENAVDAFSYLIIFSVTGILPSIVSLVVDSVPSLLLTMFINSVGLGREYVLLLKYQSVSSRFWIERLIGCTIASLIAVYSIAALSFTLLGLGLNVIKTLNIVFSLLFLSSGVIAGLEGILYLKMSYNEQVVDEVSVADGIATDV